MLHLLLALLVTTPAQAESTLLQVDREKSHIVAHADRAGLLSFLGHEHAILATRWSANLRFNRETPQASFVEISIQAASLEIDTKEAREKAGLEGAPDAEDRAKLQKKMAGEKFLNVDKFPQLKFETTEVESKEPGKLTLQGLLTLHGVTKKVSLPVTYKESSDGVYQFTGTLKVKQTDFGIEPESTAGVVKVKDELEIRIMLTTRPETAIALNRY